MELIYLWIEDYKNIKQQGFNFGPNFTCSYDAKNKELEVRKKDSINIFPSHIKLNAIIGGNGSGKSSLIEVIFLSFFNNKIIQEQDENWALFCEGNNIYISTLKGRGRTFNTQDLPEGFELIQTDYKKHFNIHYNPSLETMSSFFLNHIMKMQREYDGNIYDIRYKPLEQINAISFPNKNRHIINIKVIENTSMLNIFKAIESQKDKIDKIINSSFDIKLRFIPIKINLKIDINEFTNSFSTGDTRDMITNETTISLSLRNLYFYFFVFITQSIIKTDKISISFLKDGELKSILLRTYENKSTSIITYIYENLQDFIDTVNKIKLVDIIIDDSKKLDLNVLALANLIDIVKLEDNTNVLCKEIDNIELINKILPHIPIFITVDAQDKNGINFSDFGSGEKNIIRFVYSLIFYISFFGYNKDNDKLVDDAKLFNIMIDEIEIGLNPKCQKQLTTIIIHLLNNFNNKKFILTIASHSPFILSDIPKENVVFLQDGKQVYPDINTFGANIHTLLSHGFFLKDGLMGDFAKEKINEIIRYLNEDGTTTISDNEEAQKRIDIIGEPILRKQLQKMLDSKRLQKVDKIDKIENEIKRLSDELESLKNDKN